MAGCSSPTHTKECVLAHWLAYFKDSDHGAINADMTLSNKDWSEIAAMSRTWIGSNHQLCLWHGVNSVQKRLAQSRLVPAFYDADVAHAEFPFIRRSFVPRAQLNKLPPEEVLHIKL